MTRTKPDDYYDKETEDEKTSQCLTRKLNDIRVEKQKKNAERIKSRKARFY